jgi:hypothetical protein
LIGISSILKISSSLSPFPLRQSLIPNDGEAQSDRINAHEEEFECLALERKDKVSNVNGDHFLEQLI